MKTILIILLTVCSFAAYSQIGSLAQSGYFSRVQDSTAYVTAAATRHTAGYIDWWCSDSSGLCWVWNGSAYVNWDPTASGGGNFWASDGNTTITADVMIDPNSTSHSLKFGFNTLFDSITFTANDDILYNANDNMEFNAADTFQIAANELIFEIADDIHLNMVGSFRINNDTGTEGQVFTSHGSAPPTWEDPTGGGATAAGATGNVQYKSAGGGLQAEAAFSYDSATNLLTVPSLTAGSSTSLTDGAAITITGSKHTLTSDEATVTWTLSQLSDYSTTVFTLNASTTTWTFPATAFCIVNGNPSGDNVAVISGTSGNSYIMSIYKDGTDYTVVIKNREE